MGKLPVKNILASASAALLAITLLGGAPAFAQDQTADAVMTGMAELGMEVEGLVLTEEQVLEIQAVLNDTIDDTAKVTAIETLLEN